MAPAPRKPIPVTTCAAMRSGVPPVSCSDVIVKSADPSAIRMLVRSPAGFRRASRSRPMMAPSPAASTRRTNKSSGGMCDDISHPPLKLSEIAQKLGCRLEGDGSADIRRVTGIEHAEPGDLTFLANQKYRQQLASTRASAVILHESDPVSSSAAFGVLRSKQPYLTFAHA